MIFEKKFDFLVSIPSLLEHSNFEFMAKNLVIVESPAKGKTIEKFLGSDYRVEASFGHIRDLPAKNMGVDITGGFIPEYEISPDKKKRVTELKKLAKASERIILATDPDREGEAIAWHLAQIFELDPEKADRVTYHEITKRAISRAFSEPKHIDIDLVNAQQSRRILDRIVGYEVSPVLWKKVKPGLSAGRVQSVAVKLIVEREREIRAFIPEESWKVTVELVHETPLNIELSKIAGKKVHLKSQDAVFSWLGMHGVNTDSLTTTQDKKGNLVFSLPHSEDFILKTAEKKSSKRSPGAPFTTSTLQQEASRKLGYGVKTTMDIAQRLYQAGHITYMRTDSVHLSDLAMKSAKHFIEQEFGAEYALPKGRQFKTKQASAQEAHEAIRPTYIDKTPDATGLDGMELRLYRLIWERTVASQMKEADIETTTYHFSPEHHDEDWMVKGEVIKFAGFMKLYIEGTDDETEEEDHKKLPELAEGTRLQSQSVMGNQKFSMPPPRYTEASLVKKLEGEGIGRPSTYAPTIQTIQDRGYITVESKKLVPLDIAFVVTDYLDQEFSQMMQYSFTAEVEGQFDAIAHGELQWQKMLADFYEPFHTAVNGALGTEGKFSGERILGTDTASGRTVLARMSRFGPVIQLGSSAELAEDEKPRYANLAPGMSIDDITLEEALSLFSFPKDLGVYEDRAVSIGQGRFGPYVKWGDAYVSIPRGEDPHTIDWEGATALIEQKKREDAPLGQYDGEPYTKGKGRFGPYLKWKGMYISIPRSIDPEVISEEEAIKLITAKIEKEANRYIHRWEEENIFIENGRYGAYIKFGKKNFYLRRDGKKITDAEMIKNLTLDEVKSMILEQDENAFGTAKKATKSSAKKPTKKTTKKEGS